MLHRYECVVIPNFGGFVSHYQGAQILAHKSIILPPSKSLTFNSLLNKNDGLLAQEIVLKYGVSYKEAMRAIDIQVDKWLAQLTRPSNRVQFSSVGSFIREKKGALIFTQNAAANLLAESYGFSTVKAQVLKKEGITGKLKEELVQRQASPVFNQKLRKLVISSAAAAVFAFMFVWSYVNFDVVQNQAESLGLFFSSEQVDIDKEHTSTQVQNNQVSNNELPTDVVERSITGPATSSTNEVRNNLNASTIALNDESLSIDSESVNSILSRDISSREEDGNTEVLQGKSTDTQDKIELDNKTKIDNTKVEPIENEKSNQELHTGKYIVIAGCFRSLRNATNFVNELKSLRYDAHLSGYSVKGLYRVAYGSYDNQSDGLKSMRWIQSTHNAQAWMTRR
jgi:cell division septation protein DedD